MLAGADGAACVAMNCEVDGTEEAPAALTPTESESGIDEVERIDELGSAAEEDETAVPTISVEVGAGCAVTVTTIVLTTTEVDTAAELYTGALGDWEKDGIDEKLVDRGRLGSARDVDDDPDAAAVCERVETVYEDGPGDAEEAALEVMVALDCAGILVCAIPLVDTFVVLVD